MSDPVTDPVSDPVGGTPDARVELVRLDVTTMAALLDDDLAHASALAGVTLTPYFLTENWLWRIRHEQILNEPVYADWVARAALVDGAVVGHVGFQGPPNEIGTVEVAYAVDPEHRRRGHARRLLAAALAWAEASPTVRTVRASISPTNAGSLATIAPFGFEHVGEQWDDEDGLELLYERPAR